MPNDDYAEYLKSYYTITDEEYHNLYRKASLYIQNNKSYINELSAALNLSNDSPLHPILTDSLASFYINKLMTDYLNAKNKVNKIQNMWLDSWLLNEFTMPFFICSIMREKELKASEEIYSLSRQVRNKKSKSSISEKEAFKLRILEAKEKIRAERSEPYV